jgi:hypothetical protein
MALMTLFITLRTEPRLLNVQLQVNGNEKIHSHKWVG